MFCNKCGAEIKEGSGFCLNCGEKVSGNMAGTNIRRTYVDVDTKRSPVIKTAVVGIVVVVVAVLIIWAIFGGRGYKKVIKSAMEYSISLTEASLTEDDMEDYLKLFPDEMIDKVMEEKKYEDEDELVKELMDYCKKQMSKYEKQVEQMEGISYKIVKDEDFSEDEVKDLVQDFEDSDLVFKKKIKAAKHVTVEMTVAIKDGKEKTTEITYDLIKIGRKWYLANFQL